MGMIGLIGAEFQVETLPESALRERLSHWLGGPQEWRCLRLIGTPPTLESTSR
jgi:hypothetical protein